MQTPLQVTIREIPDSAAIEAQVAKRVAKLQQRYEQIISCKVVIDVEQKHKHQGKLFSTHIDLTVPGKEIVVSRVMNEDLYVAIRDAFNAARHQLEERNSKIKARNIKNTSHREFPNI